MDQYTIIYLLVLYKNTLNKIKRALIINALLVYNEVNNIIINKYKKENYILFALEWKFFNSYLSSEPLLLAFEWFFNFFILLEIESAIKLQNNFLNMYFMSSLKPSDLK